MAHSKDNRRGAMLLLMMTLLPLFLIPLVGLAIDGTRLYIIQAKLSAACDGAALGAGRLLGTQANTTEIAGEFLAVNFPAGYWGTRNLRPNITATNNLGTHTVNVAATVEVPLLFMRVIGQDHSTVAAAATATRRDTRVVLVLDRSGSMDVTDPVSHKNVFTVLRQSARNFVGMFNPGNDELGLIVYSGSAIVAYPVTRPYDANPHGSGGPDASFATSSTAGPVFTQIDALDAGGGTGMTEALALAHIELQKAYNRDLAAHGVDTALNAIVLFTDGVPNALAVNPNDASALPDSNSLKSSSPCSYNPETTAADTQMHGYLVAAGDPHNGWGPNYGLYLLTAYDTAKSLNYYLGHATYDQRISNPSNAVKHCGALGNGDDFSLGDLRQIPPRDIYGNSTSGTQYIHATLTYNGTGYDFTRPTSGYHVALASWNATDNVGRTIRAQTAMGQIAIYTIGYDGNGGTDTELLKRLANTQYASDYDPSQQTGKFELVHDATQLNAAFRDVASELLRLAR
jgi:Flp pilus assembly protein TadG